jgi:hypothetical protein
MFRRTHPLIRGDDIGTVISVPPRIRFDDGRAQRALSALASYGCSMRSFGDRPAIASMAVVEDFAGSVTTQKCETVSAVKPRDIRFSRHWSR